MDQILLQLEQIITGIQANLLFVGKLLAGLWIIHLLNFASGYRFNRFGLIPRNVFGLPGILFSSFLHANFSHLILNSVPLCVLASLLLLSGKDLFINVTIAIVIMSGVLTWLFARRAIHIGASGLIMGYWSYLIILAFQERSVASVLLGVVCLYYLGSLFFSIFPGKINVSWEGHLFGLIAGVVTYGTIASNFVTFQ